MPSPIHYRLTITRLIENPNYEKEMEQMKERRGFYSRSVMDNLTEPVPTMEQQSLFTIVDEEQFAAIQKACIETMK